MSVFSLTKCGQEMFLEARAQLTATAAAGEDERGSLLIRSLDKYLVWQVSYLS